jgi:hypothetical protein
METLGIAYYEQRAEEERRAAMRATCGEAAGAHGQLAKEYQAKVQALRSERDRGTDAASAFSWT